MSIAYHNNNTVSFLPFNWGNYGLTQFDKKYRVCKHTNYPHKQETNEEYLIRLNEINKTKQWDKNKKQLKL